MDASRFDALSRALGASRSRRGGLRLAAAAAVTAGAVAVAGPEASAARCSTKQPCAVCQRCRKKKCKRDPAQDGNPCAECMGCDNGACTSTRAMNLHRCDNDGTCWDGSCRTACPTFSSPAGACYWLDCSDFSTCCWLLVSEALGGNPDEATCHDRDHCSTGGACYRWATSSSEDPI